MPVATTAFSLVVVLAIGPAGSRASPSVLASGVVAYERAGDIFVANVDGSGERNLTRGRVHHAGDPDVSPNGTRIVFDDFTAPANVNAAVSYRTMVMNVDGSDLHQVGRVHSGQPRPHWSPDGALVAYGGPPDGTLDVVAPDGSGLRTIATDVRSFGFSWAPSSLEIAYGSDASLQAANLVNTARRTIAQARANNVSWSPDGSEIAFTTNLGQRLWLVGADGAALRNIFFAEGSFDAPTWSPNSRFIALGAAPRLSDPERIFAFDVTTGGPVPLTTPDFGEASYSPSWSPDGSRIVYERERIGDFLNSEGDVWVMNADGTAKAQLTSAFPSGTDTSAPEWVPGLMHIDPDPDTLATVVGRPSRVAQLAAPVEDLEADRTRAFFSSERLGVWSAQTGRIRPQRGDCEILVDLAIAGARTAWICEEQGTSFCADTLKTATLARPRPVDVVRLNYCELSVAAHGSVVFYSTGRKIWRLEGGRKRLVRMEQRVARPLSVDGDRVLLERKDGSLEIVTTAGGPCSRLALRETGCVC